MRGGRAARGCPGCDQKASGNRSPTRRAIGSDGDGELEGRVAGKRHGRRSNVMRSVFMQRLRFMFVVRSRAGRAASTARAIGGWTPAPVARSARSSGSAERTTAARGSGERRSCNDRRDRSRGAQRVGRQAGRARCAKQAAALTLTRCSARTSSESRAPRRAQAVTCASRAIKLRLLRHSCSRPGALESASLQRSDAVGAGSSRAAPARSAGQHSRS
jgi:hypothetical protein